MHFFDAVNLDNVGTGTVHVGTHHVQKVGKIHDVRLTGDVFQHGRALGQHSSQHGVHRSANGNGVKKDMCADKVVGLDMDLAVFHRVLSPKGCESLQVLVDGTRAEITAARHSDLARPKAAQQRAQKVVAGPHLAGKLVRYLSAVNMGGVNLVGAAADHADAGTQLT